MSLCAGRTGKIARCHTLSEAKYRLVELGLEPLTFSLRRCGQAQAPPGERECSCILCILILVREPWEYIGGTRRIAHSDPLV
jgi:hypothetical protein